MTDTPIRAKAGEITREDAIKLAPGCAKALRYHAQSYGPRLPDGVPQRLVLSADVLDALLREADPPAGAPKVCQHGAHGYCPHCDGWPEDSPNNTNRAASPTLSEPEREKAEMVRILKSACDRDWSDETPIQVANIAANAIYWRDREIERLLSAAAGECVKCGARYDYPQLGSTCINTAVVDGKLDVCGGRIAASPTLSEPTACASIDAENYPCELLAGHIGPHEALRGLRSFRTW